MCPCSLKELILKTLLLIIDSKVFNCCVTDYIASNWDHSDLNKTGISRKNKAHGSWHWGGSWRVGCWKGHGELLVAVSRHILLRDVPQDNSDFLIQMLGREHLVGPAWATPFSRGGQGMETSAIGWKKVPQRNPEAFFLEKGIDAVQTNKNIHLLTTKWRNFTHL